MSERLKHGLILLGLLLLVIVGALWGWARVTKPFPSLGGSTPPGPCLDTEVTAGTLVRPGQVLVNVMNASDRSGLAGDTMDALLEQGFGEGSAGNASDGTSVANVEVWTGAPDGAAAQLVASYFPGAEIVDHPELEAQITVVVGAGFTEVGRGRRAVRTDETITLCSPKPAKGAGA